MAKIERHVKQGNSDLYYHANITDEQLAEWKKYEAGEIEEPDWVHELDFDLVKDKPGNDDYELELIEE